VANALKVGNQHVERQFVAGAELDGQLPIEGRRLNSKQGGRHGHDGDGRTLSGQTPQADGPLFQDFGVRREVLKGQNIKSGKELWAAAVVGSDHREERIDGLGQLFGLFITVYYNYQRPT